MSDKNNNKDPLERLFQKKTEEYEIPYKEEDWLEMERKLDLRDAQLAHRNRTRWLAAAAILIISLLGYFTYENHNRINELTQQLSEQTDPPVADEEFMTGREDRPEAEESFENGIAESEWRPQLSVPPPDSSEELALRQPGDSTGSEEEEETGTPEGITAADRAENELTISVENFEQSVETMPVPPVFLRSTHTLSAISETFGGAAAEEKITALSQRAFPHPEKDGRPVSVTADGWISSSLAAGQNHRMERPTSSRAAISLVMAPDLSTVGSLSNFYDPGYKIGVMVEVNITSNFSITSGLASSMVRYAADGSQYRPPGYGPNGIVPDETIGECLLFDIPVNLKYNVLHFGNRSRLFATAGLSSYIMLNEEYRFHYDTYDSDQAEGWSGRTGTRHWMSNAGFSVGYELDIHPNWSLRAEPFLKVPLREVGWANVRLYSLGSFLSLNYRL